MSADASRNVILQNSISPNNGKVCSRSFSCFRAKHEHRGTTESMETRLILQYTDAAEETDGHDNAPTGSWINAKVDQWLAVIGLRDIHSTLRYDTTARYKLSSAAASDHGQCPSGR